MSVKAAPELVRLMGLPSDFRCRYRYKYQISDSIDNPDWTAVKKRVETHPEEAKVVLWLRSLDGELHYPFPGQMDEDRREPVFALTVALLADDDWRVPTDVLRTLLAASPAAAKISALVEEACYNTDQSRAAVEVILDHDPSLASAGSLRRPLFRAIRGSNIELARVVIRICPEVLGRSSNEEGNCHDDECFYPIHYACGHIDNVDPAMIRLLIKNGCKQKVGGVHGAGGLFVKGDSIFNVGGRDEQGHRKRTALETAINGFVRSPRNGTSFEWENIKVCLRAAAAAKAKQADLLDYPALHAVISFGTVHMIIKAVADIIESEDFPIEKLWEKDALGRAPIDLALENVRRFPDAEDCPTVLSELLSHGDNYGTKVAASVAADKSQALYECAVECGTGAVVLTNILRAHPSLVTRQDVTTKLFPWMLLASTPSSELTEIFDLLRRNPSSVEGGIKSSAHELYLAEKLIKKEAQWEQKEATWKREWEQKEAGWKRERESFADEISLLKAKIAKLEKGCDV